MMNVPIDIKEGMLFRAEKLLFYTDLLIKQCDSWLAEGEGKGTKARKREGAKARKREGAKNFKF